MKNSDIRSELYNIKNKYTSEGVDIVGIFGSVARNDDDKYSNIDILYRLDMDKFDRRYSGGFAKLLRLNDIRQELAEHLHRSIDFISIQNTNKTLHDEIQRDIIYV